MRTKKYVEGGSIFGPMPNAANSSQPPQQPQTNINMPGQGQQGQQQGYPFRTFTSGVQPGQQSINVGDNDLGRRNEQTGMPTFRKGGYVKAADGIAQRGKTKGRMA